VFSGGACAEQTLDKPDLSAIPPMQRRRLGPLARVVFHVLGNCVDSAADDLVIFSSRMGEIHRTQGILEALAGDEPVSPAAFSLSVHNAIAGLWSLVHGNHLPQLALAPDNGSPVPALLEAHGHMVEQPARTVTVVCYEESLPDFYHRYLESPAGVCAIALRLTVPQDGVLGLFIDHTPSTGNVQSQGFMGLVELLGRETQSSVVSGAGGNWELRVSP